MKLIFQSGLETFYTHCFVGGNGETESRSPFIKSLLGASFPPPPPPTESDFWPTMDKKEKEKWKRGTKFVSFVYRLLLNVVKTNFSKDIMCIYQEKLSEYHILFSCELMKSICFQNCRDIDVFIYFYETSCKKIICQFFLWFITWSILWSFTLN